MNISTTRFGSVDIDSDRIIFMTQPVPGFPDSRRYAVIDRPQNRPFSWLQSVDEPAVCFAVIDPTQVVPGYMAEVHPRDVADLALDGVDDSLVVCIVTISAGGSRVTVNLAAPIIVNTRRMLGRQVILEQTEHSVRHDLLKALRAQQTLPRTGSEG